MAKSLYLILNESICGIGGSYIYIMNKLNYYKKLGYDVNYIHGGHKVLSFIIPKLKPYEKNSDAHLRIPIHYFQERVQQKTINNIIRKYSLTKYENIIIESSTYNQATWGEAISKKIGAKHLVLLLSEHPVITDKNAFLFFEFKLKRKELCGITKNSLSILFDGWKDIPEDKNYCLPCYCNNSVDDVEYDRCKEIKKSDYMIGCLGRFDKPYFIPSLYDLRKYVNSYPEKSFTLILIGHTKTAKIKKEIASIFKDAPNVSLFQTGELFPIPLKLLRMADVFISSAGSCRAIRLAGKNVISYDGRDLKPIGIFRKTTEHSLFRSPSEKPCDLKELLDDVLVNKKYESDNPIADMKEINDIDFYTHRVFINNSEESKDYYDFNVCDKNRTQKIAILITSVLGANVLMSTIDFIRNRLKLNFGIESHLASFMKKNTKKEES